MGIFGRMKTLLKANVNDLASKAEDPERVMTQLIRDMEEQLGEAKIQVRDTITDQKKLEKQFESARKQAAEWERKAMVAVEAGRDDLAREALSRKQEQDELAAEFQENAERQKAAAAELRDALRGLASKIEEAKRKKGVLVAKQRKIETQNAISGTSGAVNSTSAFDSFERSAAKIEHMEAEVEASADLSDTLRDSELEQKFGKIEDDHGADDALAELKRKMGKSD